MANLLEGLTEFEREVVRRSLAASMLEEVFPEWEFHTLFGRYRHEVRATLERFPELVVDDPETDDSVAVANALNNLRGYPHGCEELLERDFGLSISEIGAVQDRLFGDTQSYAEGFR